jgi:hypothetical protein
LKTECNGQGFLFQELADRKIVVDFAGGYLSSDGGGVFLRELEVRSGLLGELSEYFIHRRDQRFVEHTVHSLISQRVNGLVLGYEDLNDHDELRRDPLHGLLAGKNDPLGQDRILERDKGKALAAHSTLNRLELGAESVDSRYHKIQPQPEKIEALLIGRGVKSIPRKVRKIVLDFDATDDPLHGAQEGGFFHGFCRQYCYLPLYCFCGNIPLYAKLRDCKRDASEGTVEALEKIVPAIRKRFGPKVHIIVRGDASFAREAIMSHCESAGLFYCFGLARNDRLQAQLEEEFERLQEPIDQGALQVPCRSFVEFEYTTLESWSRVRRVIAKAEILPKGPNPRFVVTNLPSQASKDQPLSDRFAPAALYQDFYCARGDMENRVKEQQLDLFADRTSTHWIASNQLRLWFSAFAHLMVSTLRAWVLGGTELEHASIGQIRLQLFKIAARLKVSVRRITSNCARPIPSKGFSPKSITDSGLWLSGHRQLNPNRQH